MSNTKSKKLEQAARLLRKRQLSKCLDHEHLDSRPTPKQSEILSDVNEIQHRYVVAGNQCFPGYINIRMADSTFMRRIDQIQVGDKIQSYSIKEKKLVSSTVTAVHANAPAEVYSFQFGKRFIHATSNHQIVYADGHKLSIDAATHIIDEDGVEHKKTNRWFIGIEPVYDLTVDHEDHNYIANNIVVSNSGKTSMAARELAWVINGDGPYFKRPEEWGNEPLIAMVAGQGRDMMDINIWQKKLKPLLERPNEWREIRQGNSLKYVENRRTKDIIVFTPHSDSSERNRKFMQSYSAHYVWLDEMPTSFKILDELLRRVDAKKGRFLATFTPKVVNSQIKNLIETIEPPLGKKYSMSKLDNPLYADRIQDELDKLKTYNTTMKNTILYGEWGISDTSVYAFDIDEMVADLPESYSPVGWRHIEAVDPASQSKTGYLLLAEDPKTQIWWVIFAAYIEKLYDPVSIYKQCQTYSQGKFMLYRVADSNASWFFATAASHKCQPSYIMPYKKTSRKQELIKQVQGALSSACLFEDNPTDEKYIKEKRIKIASNCDLLTEELEECRWSDATVEGGEERIINATKYHLLDSLQYAVDVIPMPKVAVAPINYGSHGAFLRVENERRMKIESAQKAARARRGAIWRR